MDNITKLPLLRAISRNYAQTIKEILEGLWHSECESLHISSEYTEGLRQLIDVLFDPKKKLSRITVLVDILPNLSKLIQDSDFIHSTLDELASHGFIRVISTRTTKKVTLTPEGLIFLELLNTAHYGGSYCYIDPDLLAQRLSELLLLYNNKISHPLDRLEKSYHERISMAEVGLLLFFLVNGSTGEENACINVDSETVQIVETIVRSFTGERLAKRNELHWRGWYLTEANRKLGGVIINQEPLYYIKLNSVSFVEDEICARVTEDMNSYSFFQDGWKRLIKAYQSGRSILEKQAIGYYSQSRTDSIFHRITNQAENKGL